MQRTDIWNRQRRIGVLLLAVGIFILIFAVGNENRGEARPLYLSGYSEQISGEPSEQSTVEFSITLHNPGGTTYEIKQIIPIVSEPFASLMITNPQLITVDDRIGKNKELTYYSQFVMDTSAMTEEELTSIFPIIERYVVTDGDGQVTVLDVT